MKIEFKKRLTPPQKIGERSAREFLAIDSATHEAIATGSEAFCALMQHTLARVLKKGDLEKYGLPKELHPLILRAGKEGLLAVAARQDAAVNSPDFPGYVVFEINLRSPGYLKSAATAQQEAEAFIPGAKTGNAIEAPLRRAWKRAAARLKDGQELVLDDLQSNSLDGDKTLALASARGAGLAERLAPAPYIPYRGDDVNRLMEIHMPKTGKTPQAKKLIDDDPGILEYFNPRLRVLPGADALVAGSKQMTVDMSDEAPKNPHIIPASRDPRDFHGRGRFAGRFAAVVRKPLNGQMCNGVEVLSIAEAKQLTSSAGKDNIFQGYVPLPEIELPGYGPVRIIARPFVIPDEKGTWRFAGHAFTRLTEPVGRGEYTNHYING